MNKRIREISELPLHRPEILRKSNKCLHFTVLKDVNVYRQFFYHKSCLERALDFYKDSWRIIYKASGKDAEDAVTLFPSIMKQCNKNRHLRAQKFSGVRMCNLCRRKNGNWHYVSDIVLSDSYTTALFAHRLAATNNYFSNRWNIIRLSTVRNGKTNREIYNHTREIEQRLRVILRNAMPYGAPFVRTLDNDVIEVICQGQNHKELIRPLRIILEDLREFITVVSLVGNSNVAICRDKEFDEDDYNEPLEDRFFMRVRYKHFQAFGSAYKNANIL